MTKKKLMIIDGNSIGFAAQDMKKLFVGEQQTQAVFGFVRSTKALLEKFPAYKPFVLWDGRAQWRFDLFSMYKGNRNVDPERVKEKEAYKTQRPFIEDAMQHLGVNQFTVKNAEADDMAGYFSRELCSVYDILLVSGDKDWCQLVNESVSWYDPRFDRHCNVENFAEFTGYPTVDAFVQGKALTGDGSDNIPGVGGIGEKGAPDFLMDHGSVEGFFRKADEKALPKMGKVMTRFAENGTPPPSKKYGELAPMRDAFYRNMKLMDLRDASKPEREFLVKRNGKLNLEAFRSLAEELMFRSVTRQFNSFTRPFVAVA